MTKLSIVIPVYNNWNFTKACLNDLKELPEDHEVIVVDNGSTDDTERSIHRLDEFNQKGNPTLIYKRFIDNTGFAHACNLGFAESHGENVMFLNNDVRVKKDKNTWTQPILKKAQTHIVGPTGGLLDSNLNFIKEMNKLEISPYFYMSGWNLTSCRNIWNQLKDSYDGPFTEEFGIAYFEDTDLSFRARELGITFEIIDVPVVHFGKITSSKLNTLRLYQPAKRNFIAKWKKRIQST